MKENLKDDIKFIIIIIATYWIFGIITQLLPPRGVVGITVKTDNKAACKHKIISLRSGYPAEEAGLSVQDCLINVNGEDIQNKNRNYVIARIKGNPGTNVNIKVTRDKQELEYSLPRVKNKIDWFRSFK